MENGAYIDANSSSPTRSAHLSIYMFDSRTHTDRLVNAMIFNFLCWILWQLALLGDECRHLSCSCGQFLAFLFGFDLVGTFVHLLDIILEQIRPRSASTHIFRLWLLPNRCRSRYVSNRSKNRLVAVIFRVYWNLVNV